MRGTVRLGEPLIGLEVGSLDQIDAAGSGREDGIEALAVPGVPLQVGTEPSSLNATPRWRR